jgi:2-polyprenyl-6-methoxyphenol hydroxylase-like FAD-dependent oxidoreductase
MRAVIVGAGMGGLMTTLALRQSGVLASVVRYSQPLVTPVLAPSDRFLGMCSSKDTSTTC